MSDLKRTAYKDVKQVLDKDDNVIKVVYTQNILDEMKEKKLVSKPAKVVSNKKTLTIRQQLQVLHYLGALKIIDEQKVIDKKSDFLVLLIGKTKQNIRENYKYHSENLITSKLKPERKKIAKELTHIKKVFENLGNIRLMRKVEADLKRLDRLGF